jgi:hypothetical protein
VLLPRAHVGGWCGCPRQVKAAVDLINAIVGKRADVSSTTINVGSKVGAVIGKGGTCRC